MASNHILEASESPFCGWEWGLWSRWIHRISLHILSSCVILASLMAIAHLAYFWQRVRWVGKAEEIENFMSQHMWRPMTYVGDVVRCRSFMVWLGKVGWGEIMQAYQHTGHLLIWIHCNCRIFHTLKSLIWLIYNYKYIYKHIDIYLYRDLYQQYIYICIDCSI